MSDIITERDKYKKGWKGGLPETPCGHGSKLSTTEKQRIWIPQIVNKYQIQTIADIGAGDLNWITQVNWPHEIGYQAYDLVPRRPGVREFDLIQEIPPKVDLLMCLWVLNHLPYEHCEKAIENLKASGSKYLLMTDRPKWHTEQPPEIQMPYIESLELNHKHDSLRLIEL